LRIGRGRDLKSLFRLFADSAKHLRARLVDPHEPRLREPKSFVRTAALGVTVDVDRCGSLAMTASRLFEKILEEAIAEVRARRVPVFTFALYHDHESAAVSVCVDTEENSKKVVQSINSFNMKYFTKAVRSGDLKDAALWRANIGRSLSLGDFTMVNVARRDLGKVAVNGGDGAPMPRAAAVAALTLRRPSRRALSGKMIQIGGAWWDTPCGRGRRGPDPKRWER
jgi:hypothetical protein